MEYSFPSLRFALFCGYVEGYNGAAKISCAGFMAFSVREGAERTIGCDEGGWRLDGGG